MAWITITEALVTSKLSGPELAALKSAALATGQSDPLVEVIAQIVTEVRGYVGASARNTLGEGATIPDELLGAAISRIRFELATRLPVASLLTTARTEANTQALDRLRDAAAGRFAVIQPTTVAAAQAGGPAVQIVSTSCRRATNAGLAGL